PSALRRRTDRAGVPGAGAPARGSCRDLLAGGGKNPARPAMVSAADGERRAERRHGYRTACERRRRRAVPNPAPDGKEAPDPNPYGLHWLSDRGRPALPAIERHG